MLSSYPRGSSSFYSCVYKTQDLFSYTACIESSYFLHATCMPTYSNSTGCIHTVCREIGVRTDIYLYIYRHCPTRVLKIECFHRDSGMHSENKTFSILNSMAVYTPPAVMFFKNTVYSLVNLYPTPPPLQIKTDCSNLKNSCIM